MKVKVTTRHFFHFEYDAGLLTKQIWKLNGNKRRKLKANIAKRGYKHPFNCCFIFRSKVFYRSTP